MRKKIISFLVAAFIVPTLGAAAEGRLDFPESGFLPGWKAEPIRRILSSADLYAYIDGGAELYLEYYFDKLYVCEYRHPQWGALTIETCRFVQPEDAWGMFNLDTTGVPWSIERESRGPDSTGSGVLRCWKGHYFVRAFAWSPSPDATAALKFAVQSLMEGIEDAPLPAWLESIRKSGGRAVFFRGEIALRQITGAAAPREVPFVRDQGAVWIRSDSLLKKFPALILRFADEEDTERKFHRIWSKITADVQNFVLTEKRGLASLKNHTATGIEAIGDFLIWIPNAADEEACADALDDLRRILAGEKE